MTRSVRAALFDVDGALADTNYLHAVTWWEAFGQAGYQPSMADIHRAIGMGSEHMPDQLLPADRDRDADADMRAAHSTLYATYWSRLRPLPGAAAPGINEAGSPAPGPPIRCGCLIHVAVTA